jgi:hypothetical protein
LPWHFPRWFFVPRFIDPPFSGVKASKGESNQGHRERVVLVCHVFRLNGA